MQIFRNNTKKIYSKFSYFKIISKDHKFLFFEDGLIMNFAYTASMAIFIIS